MSTKDTIKSTEAAAVVMEGIQVELQDTQATLVELHHDITRLNLGEIITPIPYHTLFDPEVIFTRREKEGWQCGKRVWNP